MARKKKPSAGPSNAYLLSFGDTMTTLLAFFIVLNSLAEDQTGANLHSGTGSFAQAMTSLGGGGSVPGNRGKTVVRQEAPMPDYVVPDPDGQQSETGNAGPDDNPNDLRVIDRDRDDFERMMDEMSRLAELDKKTAVKGEAVFDYFRRLNSEAPLLSQEYRDEMTNVIPLLHQKQYEVVLIVWATTPGRKAWQRATEQASAIAEELATMARLSEKQRGQLRGIAKPWFDQDAKRPVLSVIARRVSTTNL